MPEQLTEQSKGWVESIDETADQLVDGWIRLRRHLHRHPELSGRETLTTQYLKTFLAELGLPLNVAGGGCGLTADLITDSGPIHRPIIAIRGDIDGLPIQDEKAVPYRSSVKGVMHACGHDVHASVIVATMQLLCRLRDESRLPWPIAVRAILQPSEETAEGALHMIANNALQDVGAVLALHVDPSRQVGQIGLRDNVLTASCDMFEVRFEGAGGHGARPHLTKDPIDACTHWVQSAYRRIPRAINAHKTVVLSVGMIEAGHSANVIPDTARVCGTLRSLCSDARDRSLAILQDICTATAIDTGCEVHFRRGMSAPAVVNDPALVKLLQRSALSVFDADRLEWIEEPSMGSEDFSYYLQKIPGAMFRLGVAGDDVGDAPLHTAEFDIDEQAIVHAAKLFATSVVNYFDPSRS